METGSKLIFEADLNFAQGFEDFVFVSMLDEAAFCKVSLKYMPWPPHSWCASWVGAALVIGKMRLCEV